MKNNLFISLIVLYFCINPSIIFAGTEGQIRGRVSNIDGESLVGAQVYIEELGIGAVADPGGNYIIINIPVGEYDVTATMISYRTQVFSKVKVIMDNTVWLNFSLDVEAIEGDIIYVSGEKDLVDKGATSKKITVGQEAIEALPIRDVSELYSLQSGVVKVEAGMRGGIPDHEERGLEEVHVRGGRTGEIAYLIDGMYIRNPIYGGIGNGTRLNLFAVKEFDWQPGGFNAEYGDAMSAVSNMHTTIGGAEFSFKFKYETSMVGAELGNHYDELRGYNDYNLGFGGKVPLLNKLNYWISGQHTSYENYRVYQFDSLKYLHGVEVPQGTKYLNKSDINGNTISPPTDNTDNQFNKFNEVQPWDDEVGFRGFGFDDTWDIFGKLAYKPTNKLKFQLSYWVVEAHRKIFSPNYLYWDAGQNEMFRDTKRISLEMNHSLSARTFYTLRYSRFRQGSFTGVRLKDSDSDGFPDWFELRHGAGDRTNYAGDKKLSDPYNPNVVPFVEAGSGSIDYIREDGKGPKDWVSGWYYGAEYGNYNWDIAEDFIDENSDGIHQSTEPYTDDNNDGKWQGPSLIEKCEYRDGSYWLTPEMYVSNEYFQDLESMWIETYQDPNVDYNGFSLFYDDNGNLTDSLYFGPYSDASMQGNWDEGNIFGGHDRFYSTSNAITNEFRFDMTSQINDKLRARLGIDLKSHKLTFYEVERPWLGPQASRQRFAEQWDDYGVDGIEVSLSENPEDPDPGEGNGVWDGPVSIDGVSYPGENFDDFNGNDMWDDFVEPMEIAGYFQTFYELPWMVVNAGVRVDAVNYNTKIWSDPFGNYSPTIPWFWEDCGQDTLCAAHDNSMSHTDPSQPGIHIPDDGENDGIFNHFSDSDIPHEITTDELGSRNMPQVFFEYSEWLYKISPRFGISHILTDGATFTFNYGLYYQTPVYEHIYLNTNRQENPAEVIVESEGFIGNATMVASRTQSYEFGFNVQVGRHWAYSVAGWVKDMDQLASAKTYRSTLGDYIVAANGDYGVAKGFDISLENRGRLINTTIQYTFSRAKANSEYDKKAFDKNKEVDAPLQEFTMPFDRPHDLVVQLYSSKLPFKINASLVGYYQSGFPYTGTYEKASGEPEADVKNRYSKRSPAFKQIDISFSRYFTFKDFDLSLGMNVFNLFDIQNVIDLYPETGDPDYRSDYFMDDVKLPEKGGTKSRSYYDSPWHYSTPREINVFLRIDYK